MTELIIALVIALVFLKVLKSVLHRLRFKLGIGRKLIWVDEGHQTKPFFNHVYEVLGKPDLMYRTAGGVLAVEYKSRRGPVYPSDIAQAKCAALAARGSGYLVTHLLVKTSTQEKYIDLPKADKVLFSEIKHLIKIAREAKYGMPQAAAPQTGKCRGCAFSYGCDKRAGC